MREHTKAWLEFWCYVALCLLAVAVVWITA